MTDNADIEKQAIKQRQCQDFADLQDEMAGRENGRPKRFDIADKRKHEKAEKQRTQNTLRAILMANAAYAAFYNKTLQLLGDTKISVYEAIITGQKRLKQAQHNI